MRSAGSAQAGGWCPDRGEGGQERFVGVNIDVTDAKSAEAAIAASEAEFRALFENSVIGKVQADMATLHFVRVNQSFCDMVGYRKAELLAGMTFLDVMHPENRALDEAAFREAMAEDQPYSAEMRLLHKDGSARWVIMSVAPLPPTPGRPARTVASLQDITDRRQAEERQVLLAREVDHRAKNVLAVVQGAIRLTPKEDAATFARSVEGRVGALARAQTLLAKGRWSGAELRTLIEGELAGFIGAGGGGTQPQAYLEGPPLLIVAEAAQPIAMAVHELATNATKYGALSAPGGVVSITWAVDPVEGLLLLDWSETGGPSVPGPPSRPGFGSRVLKATLHQLGGSAILDWRPAGLACRLRAPLRRVVVDQQTGPLTRMAARSD